MGKTNAYYNEQCHHNAINICRHWASKNAETWNLFSKEKGDHFWDPDVGVGKGNVVPVLNLLSTMPWRHVSEWRYSSTFLDIGTEWRWVVRLTPLPLYTLGERDCGTHWRGSWVGPGAGLDAIEKRKTLHCRESNPGHSARSPSLYRLS
jgi:hypothetical protein